MIVSVARIELRLEFAHSLKEKRRVLRSLIDRTRSRFGVRVAEVDGQDTWQRAVLGFAVVGADGAKVDGIRDQIAESIIESAGGSVVADERESMYFGDASVSRSERLT